MIRYVPARDYETKRSRFFRVAITSFLYIPQQGSLIPDVEKVLLQSMNSLHHMLYPDHGSGSPPHIIYKSRACHPYRINSLPLLFIPNRELYRQEKFPKERARPPSFSAKRAILLNIIKRHQEPNRGLPHPDRPEQQPPSPSPAG